MCCIVALIHVFCIFVSSSCPDRFEIYYLCLNGCTRASYLHPTHNVGHTVVQHTLQHGRLIIVGRTKSDHYDWELEDPEGLKEESEGPESSESVHSSSDDTACACSLWATARRVTDACVVPNML